jgi:hypothetical protein
MPPDPDDTGPGRFARGRSGNPKGRPRKPPAKKGPVVPLRTPSQFSETILKVANRPATVIEGGKKETMTLFEFNSLRLGTSGNDRLARKDFVEMTLSASRQLAWAERHPLKRK